MDISSNQILQISIEACQVNLKYATKLDLIDSLLDPFPPHIYHDHTFYVSQNKTICH